LVNLKIKKEKWKSLADDSVLLLLLLLLLLMMELKIDHKKKHTHVPHLNIKIEAAE